MPDTPPLVLGIDVGTSAVKLLLVDPDGSIVAKANKPYPVSAPHPGWSEQNPEDWWTATCAGIHELLANPGVTSDRIVCLGLTGQMHGMVPLDSAGAVLRPAILWNDQRSQPQCDALHAQLGREHIIATTGKPMLPSFTAPKVLWMRNLEPELHARIATVLLPKDFIQHKLSGEFRSDVADSSGTSYLDLAARTWSPDLLDAIGLNTSNVPTLHESVEVCAQVAPHAAEATGLRPGTPIVAGAGDQAAEGIGSGIVRPGAVSVAVGTSGVAFAATDAAAPDPAGAIHSYCSAVPDGHHVMGVMLSAGGSFNWCVKALYPDLTEPPHAAVLDRAEAIDPGASGLTFLPYLTGERCPHPDPDARGCFVGLAPSHTRDHMARAVLEGVAFGLRDLIALIPTPSSNPDMESIRVTGGLTRSAFFRQLCADVWNLRVTAPAASEGAAYGAAVLALVGGGLHASVESAAELLVTDAYESNPSAERAWADAGYARYRALYPALAPCFSRTDE